MNDTPRTLAIPPWSRACFAYAVALSLLEFVLIALKPELFRAVLVADAAMGWLVVVAAAQGLRAVEFPPPFRFLAAWSLAAGHWLAALIGVLAMQ